MKPWEGKHWLEQEKYLKSYKQPDEGIGMQIFQDGIICAFLRLQQALYNDWEEAQKLKHTGECKISTCEYCPVCGIEIDKE